MTAERTIDRDMRIGSVIFRKGVKESTVLGAAARAFEQHPIGHIDIQAGTDGMESMGTTPAEPRVSVRIFGPGMKLRPLDEICREVIDLALLHFGPRGKKDAAEALGIGRSTIYRKLKP